MLSKVHQVGNYSISETNPIRSQDQRRFVVQKQGAKSPYVVTFQRRHQYGCSCPAGRNQKHCKHVTFCMGIFQ